MSRNHIPDRSHRAQVHRYSVTTSPNSVVTFSSMLTVGASFHHTQRGRPHSRIPLSFEGVGRRIEAQGASVSDNGGDRFVGNLFHTARAGLSSPQLLAQRADQFEAVETTGTVETVPDSPIVSDQAGGGAAMRTLFDQVRHAPPPLLPGTR